MTPAIAATGLKGFLQWLQADQPGIYAATAARIAKAVPKGFSGFNGSVLQNMRLAQGRRSMRLRGYTLSGCCATCSVQLQTVSSCAISVAPNICLDTSCAANAGSTCGSTLTGVANIISSVAGAALNASQAQAYNSMVQSQLSRAATGLSPLTLSSTAVGVPRLLGGAAGSSTGTLVLLGGAALILIMLARK